ncbi:hypothetical protein J2T13_000201 [Paenibacillus sp. DS2015]|uniref:hypothetical protein n=1 Tax=Paenibacillus sp. DS2015 TaxID=3373917 RepID=UPI003D1E7DFB
MSNLKWRVSAHTLRRVNERFGIEVKSATNWVNQLMERANYVCNGIGEDGNPSRVFTVDKKIFHADIINDVIITVYEAEIKRPIAPAVALTLAKEIRKMEIDLLKREQLAIERRSPIESEIITMRLSLVRAKKESRINFFTKRIAELETQLRYINAELTSWKRDLTLFAESYASIM